MTYVDGVNAVAVDQFLGALESGNYTQGMHRLHTRADDSMCCLGVATVELGPQCGVRAVNLETDSELDISVFYEDEYGNRYYLLMPPAVTELLGIPETYIEHSGSGDVILVEQEKEDEDDGFYYREGMCLVAVSTLNDRGAPFSEIARRIRETLSVKEA